MKVFKSEKGRRMIMESYDKLLGQWGIQYEEKDINGRYGATHVIEAGKPDYPPLMLFHGVGDNSALMWIYNAKALCTGYRIIAVDAMGGAGKSLPGKEYKKGFRQSEWIRELMDEMGIEKADAAGVSYGCYLAQLLKFELPDRFGRIVGMSGSVSIEGQKGVGLKMLRAFLPEALFPNDKNAMKLFEKLSGTDSSNISVNPDLFEHWKLLLRNFNNMSMTKHETKKQFSHRSYEAVRDDLLFLIGDHDILAYDSRSISLMDELGIKYEIVRGAGHVINYEMPDLINEKILTFLKK